MKQRRLDRHLTKLRVGEFEVATSGGIWVAIRAYTHALHAQACQEAAQQRQVLVKHVLVRKGQAVYCAVIKEAYTVPEGPDCWTVETSWPERARFTVACKNTIACPAAGCSCLGPSAPDSEPDLEVTCQ